MRIQVLDHGYVEFIEAWGSGSTGHDINQGSAACDYSPRSDEDMECGIIEAARQSTQGSFRGWEPAPCDCNTQTEFHRQNCNSRKNPGDRRLLKNLYEHKHMSPFEFAGMTLEIQLPLFVRSEWHRHRTQSYNEMSARYVALPDLYYVPSVENVEMRILKAHDTKNKQEALGFLDVGDGDFEASAKQRAIDYVARLEYVYSECEARYQKDLYSIPKELARLIMPVGHYTKMRATANLRN
jgi:thymidylate synthase (FAD)